MGVNAETPVRYSQICVGMSVSVGMSGRAPCAIANTTWEYRKRCS